MEPDDRTLTCLDAALAKIQAKLTASPGGVVTLPSHADLFELAMNAAILASKLAHEAAARQADEEAVTLEAMRALAADRAKREGQADG